MSIASRLSELRCYMKEVGVSCCLIPTSDCHDSEYISDYFKVREYFSGFTGSAGTLVVSLDKAALFTDARYFIQAENELEGTEIMLMRMGEDNVPALNDYLYNIINSGEKLGLDGKIIGAKQGLSIEKKLSLKGAYVDYTFDPACVWIKRPELVFNDVFILPEKYTGEATKDKLKRIREFMREKGSDYHIITSLDDIAWILNLRGSDVMSCPVFFAYMVISMEDATLYANIESEEIISYLSDAGIALSKYDDFYENGIQRVNNCTVKALLYDQSRISYFVYKNLKDGLTVLDVMSPSTQFKCIKNNVEIDNLVKANILDGVAMVKFDHWLRDAINEGEHLTELIIQDKLLSFRKQSDSFIELSFDTICAYAEHGAIIHYSATEESDVEVKKGSLLMIDSGAHYYEGSTDVTRTYAIGDIPEHMMKDYTMVLRSNLRLLNHQFLYGTRGNTLDVVARELFWRRGVDFKHGTGHGIGYCLDVHEGPNRISWKQLDTNPASIAFEPGMLTSDEPGYYVEGSHGIRIETDILCEERFCNEYGRFLGFRPMTFAPIDVRAIYWPDMTDEDKKNLDGYHREVYMRLSPFLEGEDLKYLEEVTKCCNSI